MGEAKRRTPSAAGRASTRLASCKGDKSRGAAEHMSLGSGEVGFQGRQVFRRGTTHMFFLPCSRSR